MYLNWLSGMHRNNLSRAEGDRTVIASAARQQVPWQLKSCRKPSPKTLAANLSRLHWGRLLAAVAILKLFIFSFRNLPDRIYSIITRRQTANHDTQGWTLKERQENPDLT